MAGERILILDDDKLIRDVVSERLDRRGYDVRAAQNLDEARKTLDEFEPDVGLLDIRLPDGEGTELLEGLVGEGDTPCIMMTAHGTVASAVEALKQGASDYLEKPFDLDRLEATIQGVLERTRLRRQVKALRDQNALAGPMVATSPAMKQVLELVEKIAPAEGATVLIQGETGTGKGVLAHTIHRLSPRAEGPFVSVTCSALAETLMESELFGHEKGAFTDAHAMKRGLVEVASGGTLFLDEIAELSTRLQGKLLGFIEEKTFRRVGGTQDLKVDVRLVAATNRNLEQAVEDGSFREDLYYRLRVVPVTLPPLRHRRGDVEPLAAHFVDSFNGEFGKQIEAIEPDAMELLERYDWPGNIRELKNVIERAVLLTDGSTITVDALPPELRGGSDDSDERVIPRFGPDGVDLEELERALLKEALQRSDGNRTEAGRLLGLSRHQVRNRLDKYGEDL